MSEASEATPAAPYQVLARKYRPQSFDDLIGHDAMVRTLRNAFAAGRIAHAYVLTGVRGVGKTTTARILARAFNYLTEDDAAAGRDPGPQIDMPSLGVHCAAIAESRHPDVLEMDAASRTGVGDIRELIEGVRYAPVEARYKIYIIDEVHMLSTAAFNALLKTLEEPPAHVKFIFATTEIRKLPVTVLSRCQRFDLRRIEPEALQTHLKSIAEKEGATIDDDGVAMIARAAEGSVRDALSILDQAIVQHRDDESGAQVDGEAVRDMLGLADRTRVWALLDAAFSGDAKGALDEFRHQYDAGADPATILRDLLELTHLVTRVAAAGPEAASTGPAGDADAARARERAETFPVNALSRAWSLLMKGLAEVAAAPDPAAAADMALIRLAFAAQLPTPDEALRLLKTERGDQSAAPAAPASAPAPAPVAQFAPPPTPPPTPSATAPATPTDEPAPTLRSLEDVARLAGRKRDATLRTELESFVRVVDFQPGRIEMQLEPRAPGDLANRLTRSLRDWTGIHWVVTVNQNADAAPPIREARHAEVMAHPDVKKAFELFPNAKIAAIRDIDPPLDHDGDEPGEDAPNAEESAGG
ncbi:MAG: DNA polymerase III subunit gamma/tau [Pseudomonadota bacterium]